MIEQLSKYTIRRREDQAYCVGCSYALYIGDRAYMDLKNRVFCSQECFRSYMKLLKIKQMRKINQIFSLLLILYLREGRI